MRRRSASATRISVGPEAEFFVFDDVALAAATPYNTSFMRRRDVELPINCVHRVRGRQPRPPHRASRAATSRCRRRTRLQDMPLRDARRHGRRWASPSRSTTTRWPVGPARARHRSSTRSSAHGRQHPDLSSTPCTQRRTDAYGKTATFMPKPVYRRQRLGHARAPVDLEERQAALRRQQVCRPVGRLPVVHRRHPEARQGHATPSPTRRPTPYKRLVPGYEAPVLLAYSAGQPARPPAASRTDDQRRRPSASRSASPTRSANSVPRLRGAAHGRPRRHHEQDRPGPGDGQGPLRPAAGRARRRSRRCAASLREALAAASTPDNAFLKAGGVFDRRLQIDALHRAEDGRECALRDDAAPGRVRRCTTPAEGGLASASRSLDIERGALRGAARLRSGVPVVARRRRPRDASPG